MVCLPTEEILSMSQPIRLNLEELRQKDLKVLIVDDVEFNLVLLTRYLENLGIKNIDLAKNGKQAMEMYTRAYEQHKPYDIITMDIEMPVMDGKTATGEIRKFEYSHDGPRSKIIMVSGNCGESEIKSCLDKNGNIKANHFLKKPVSLDDLKECLLNPKTL